jgi:hypothetical protein
MFAAAGIIIIITLCVAHFCLKSSALASFAAVISVVLAFIVSFGYYEVAADILISRGKGGQWAQPTAFLFIFLAVFAVAKSITDSLAKSDVDFGVVAKRVTGVIAGIIVGLIISGVLLVGLAMSPVAAKWPYPRFGEAGISAENPDKCLLNADGLVAGLFGWISRGSLSSQKSFSVYHADFINQLHLNRRKVKDEVYSIAAAGSVVVPAKDGVRIQDFGEYTFTVVSMGVKSGEISDGGAMDKTGRVSFTPAQARLICKERDRARTMGGSAKAVYPEGEIIDQQFVRKRLDDVIELSRNDFEASSAYGRVAWVDFAFRVPSGMTAVLLEFKQNAVTAIPKPVRGTETTEQLNPEE